MEIDRILYKEIFGKSTDFSEKKDCTAMIAIHYLLNRQNIYDKSRVALDFTLTEEGLTNPKWNQSIKARELTDLAPGPKLSARASIVVESLRYSINKTATTYEVGPRSLAMAMAGLAYLRKNVFYDNELLKEQEKTFDKELICFSGMFNICNQAFKTFNARKKKLKEEKNITD